jgi:hypothetical protein
MRDHVPFDSAEPRDEHVPIMIGAVRGRIDADHPRRHGIVDLIDFDVARQRLEAFIEHLPKISVGQPCNHCGQCRWRDRCGAEWEETDHLSLVANITRSQMAKLDAASVTTMSALARIAPRARIANLQPDTLERLSGQPSRRAAGPRRPRRTGAGRGRSRAGSRES